MPAPEVHECHRGGHARTQRGQPDRGTGSEQNPVGPVQAVQRSGHQQAVWAELLALEDNTVPSLAVMEQFSRLTRNRLEASTEPTSELEMGSW